MKRTRGTGSIGKQVRSPYYFIRYYDGSGRQRKESCKSADPAVAERLLQKRLGQIQLGLLPEKSARYEDARKLLLQDYALRQHKSLQVLKDKSITIWGLPHLDSHFKRMRVTHIDSESMMKFIAARQKRGASNSTINRNLSLLRRMLHLAQRQKWLATVPHVPMMKEGMARQGFVEREDFEKIRTALPAHLHPLVTLCYTTGVRLGEATSILWAQVDIPNKRIALHEGQTKSGKARVLPISSELGAMLVHGKNWLYAFPAKNLRKEWIKATKAAKCPGLLFHDLRRSAVRNMMRSGVAQAVAMKISGHSTVYVFNRYNIVSEDDIQDAMDKVEGRKS